MTQPFAATLPAEESRGLAIKAKAGDVASRDRLMAHNEGLVTVISRSYAGRGLDLEDLKQYARIGVMDAIRTFDPARGTISKHMSVAISQHVAAAIEDLGQIVREPRKLCRLRRRLRSKHPDWQTMGSQEIADSMGVTAATAQELAFPKMKRRDVDLQFHAGRREDEELARDSRSQQVRRWINTSNLTDHERHTITRLFGIDCLAETTDALAKSRKCRHQSITIAKQAAIAKLKASPLRLSRHMNQY